MYNREAKEVVMKINETFKVLLVTGPRQTGKTTLLKSIMPDGMSYVTLDDKALREQAQEDPALFLEEHPAPLFIDEVQYAPDLFSYIKIKVDNSNEYGQYWLTGSQQFYLMKNASESLAGRVGIVNLNSFTYSEIVKNENKELFDPSEFKKSEKVNVNDVFEIIFRGGMPEFYNNAGVERELYFKSYINTYIEKDIRGLYGINKVSSFRKFMVSVASRVGEQLNYSDIALDAGVSVPTVTSWMSILVASGIVYLLEPFMSSELKRLTHIPKIYFMDSGLAAYLAGWESARDLQLSSVSGHYLENFIVSEIVKSYNAKGKTPNISYYRDKEQNEIDLVFYKNNTLYPFEIKKSASPNRSMIKNFKALEKGNKEIGNGGVICFYETLMKLDEKNYVIPISSVVNLNKN